MMGIHQSNPKYVLFHPQSIPLVPSTTHRAHEHLGWCLAMLFEMNALHNNNTWELVPCEPSMNIIRCKLVFKRKLNLDGMLQRRQDLLLKATIKSLVESTWKHIAQ